MNSYSGSALWESLGSLSCILPHLWKCISFLNILFQGLTCSYTPHLITNPMLGLWQYSSSFDVAYNFIFISFHDLFQFGKLQILFGVMANFVIQTLQKNSMWKNQRHVWKGLYCKIFLMNHIMHIDDKCNIVTLDLNYHSWFKALEGVDPLIIKTHQPWSNDLYVSSFILLWKSS
jgi:hypothetical protein